MLCGHAWAENCAGRKGLWRNWRSARWRALRRYFKRKKTEQHSCAMQSTARLSGGNGAHPRHGSGRPAAAEGATATRPRFDFAKRLSRRRPSRLGRPFRCRSRGRGPRACRPNGSLDDGPEEDCAQDRGKKARRLSAGIAHTRVDEAVGPLLAYWPSQEFLATSFLRAASRLRSVQRVPTTLPDVWRRRTR